jgi:hypothetical protein
MLNEEIVYDKITKCTNTIELRNIGIYLNEVKCKWGNKMRNFHLNCAEGSKNVLILITCTARVQQGYSKGTARVQQGYSKGTALAETVILELWAAKTSAQRSQLNK